jgi:hypothetical protein
LTYNEWEAQQRLSPSSPEAHAAEVAWNAALTEVRRLVAAGAAAESTSNGLAVLLETEIDALTTDLGTTF